jgi:hypothetical protein
MSAEYDNIRELLAETWAAWQPWMEEAKTDLKYYLGDQWSAADKAYLDQEGRPYLVINKLVRRFVHLLTGYQRQNRLAVSYKPFEGSDNQAAEQFSNLILHQLEKRNGHHQISQCFRTNIKTGLDWVNLYMDYDDDLENGDIVFKRTPWTRLLPDPLFQELDGSDMNFLFRREYLTQKQLEMMLPAGTNVENEFNKTAMGEYTPILDPQEYMIGSQDRYLVTEYWSREFTRKDHLLDRTTGEMRPIEIGGSKPRERLRDILQQFPQLMLYKKRTKTEKLQLFIGDELVWKGEDPNGAGDFPYVPFIAYYDPEFDQMKWKLQGIVRQLRDPQEELNKRRSAMLHIMNTMAINGWMWEEGAMADETQMDQAAGAGVQLRLSKGALQQNMIKQIEKTQFPGEMVKMEEMLAADGPDISGINAEMLAMMDKDMPGITIQLRQRQGLIIIQELFDNLRIAQKGIGKRFMSMVQANWDAKKVGRILNEQPSPEFYKQDFQRYDAIIDTAQNSPTARDAQFFKMMWFNANVSPVHPMILLELADIPEKYRNIQGQMMLQAMQGGGMEPNKVTEGGQKPKDNSAGLMAARMPAQGGM